MTTPTLKSVAKLCIVPPWENGEGLTVFRVHKDNIVKVMIQMEELGYGGFCEASTIEPDNEYRGVFLDLTYELRNP